MAKPCDVFVMPDGRRLCGPALFVPAFGKCGTNALSSYTLAHPNVRWSHASEVRFDPRKQNPATLVLQHNPGVTPDDDFVWAIKSPAEAHKESSALGAAIRQAYPSAKVALALCNPALLPFRWYRHYLSRSLKRLSNCDDSPVPICQVATPVSLSELVDFLHRRFPTTNLMSL